MRWITIIKVGGSIISGVLTASSLILNIQGVSQLLGYKVQWQWWALGGFMVFACFMAWIIYGLRQDPAVAEARKEHLKEIENLIKEWNGAIKISKVDEVRPHEDPAPWAQIWVEKNPLFQGVKEHLPSKDLWETYSQWKGAETQYRDACNKLRSKIRRSWTLPGHLDNDFEQPIMRALERRRLGQNIEELGFWSRDSKYYTSDKTQAVTWELFAGGFRLADDIPVEANISEYEKHYQEIHDEILKNEAEGVMELSRRGAELETRIHASLQKILLSRNYVYRTCNFCRGQA